MYKHQLTNLQWSFILGREYFSHLCTRTSTYSKSLFSTIYHVLLHFLYLYHTASILKHLLYLTCSSIMEIMKVHQPFTKVGLVKNCWLLCQFYYTYEIVNNMCISKEKSVRHYVDLFLQKFRNYLGRGGGVVGGRGGGVRVECQLRTSKSGVCIDRAKEGCGVQNLDFFCECYK